MRTNALVDAVRAEITSRGDVGAAIVGDINADPTDLPSLSALLDAGWVDIGANAHVWGRTSNLPTSAAPNSTKAPNRRDFAIASPELVPLIIDFDVAWDDNYTVHAALNVLFKPQGTNIITNRNLKPAAL